MESVLGNLVTIYEKAEVKKQEPVEPAKMTQKLEEEE